MILNTEKELENYNLVNRAFHGNKDTYLFGGLEANVAPAYNALNNDYERVDWMKFDTYRIHNVIARMANQGAFVTNQRYLDVINSVFSDEQFQRKDTEAGRDWVIVELVKSGQWPPTTEVVSQILIDAWDQLPDNGTFRDNKAADDQRNAQIAEMTGNGEHGFSIQRGPRKFAYEKDGRAHDPMAGQAKGFSLGIQGPWSRGAGSKSFDEMSNEEVNALYQEWKTTTDFRNMSKEDLRKLVRSNGATDLFGKNVRVLSVAAPDGEQQLINEATGKEFTQRELIRYINAAPMNGRNMLVNPNTGRMIPWKKERFERIIRGELG